MTFLFSVYLQRPRSRPRIKASGYPDDNWYRPEVPKGCSGETPAFSLTSPENSPLATRRSGSWVNTNDRIFGLRQLVTRNARVPRGHRGPQDSPVCASLPRGESRETHNVQSIDNDTHTSAVSEFSLQASIWITSITWIVLLVHLNHLWITAVTVHYTASQNVHCHFLSSFFCIGVISDDTYGFLQRKKLFLELLRQAWRICAS